MANPKHPPRVIHLSSFTSLSVVEGLGTVDVTIRAGLFQQTVPMAPSQAHEIASLLRCVAFEVTEAGK